MEKLTVLTNAKNSTDTTKKYFINYVFWLEGRNFFLMGGGRINFAKQNGVGPVDNRTYT